MAWAKNYTGKRAKIMPRLVPEQPKGQRAKRIRPRVGWLHIGRTRKQVRESVS
jgi:hypothetical protein